MYISSCWIIWG